MLSFFTAVSLLQTKPRDFFFPGSGPVYSNLDIFFLIAARQSCKNGYVCGFGAICGAIGCTHPCQSKRSKFLCEAFHDALYLFRLPSAQYRGILIASQAVGDS
jgi:hypothetical protein